MQMYGELYNAAVQLSIESILRDVNFRYIYNLLKKIMTLNEFNCCPRTQQVNLVLQTGVLLFSKQTTTSEIILYQWNSFYIELVYGRNYSFLKYLKAFTDTDELDVYLQEIDLHEIFVQL